MAKKEVADEKDEKDDEAEELVVVTDHPDDVEAEMGDGHESVKTPPKAAKKEEPEDEDTEEARLGKSEDDDEDEEVQKKGKKSRHQRRKEGENRLRVELKFLESRNDQLERQLQVVARRQDQSEINTIEDKIARTKQLIAKAEDVMAEATTAGKGVESVEATRIRDKLKDDLKNFEEFQAQAKEKSEAPERPKPNPRVANNVKSWHKDNSWFDFNRGDMDSKIAGAIDDSVHEEGFDPATEDYWQELNARIAKALPHRAKKAVKNGKGDDEGLENDDEDEEEEVKKAPPKKRAAGATGGPKFRTGGPGRELSANEVHLSRERIAALKEAGAWDDKQLRAKYLKRYQQYDQEHAND